MRGFDKNVLKSKLFIPFHFCLLAFLRSYLCVILEHIILYHTNPNDTICGCKEKRYKNIRERKKMSVREKGKKAI